MNVREMYARLHKYDCRRSEIRAITGITDEEFDAIMATKHLDRELPEEFEERLWKGVEATMNTKREQSMALCDDEKTVFLLSNAIIIQATDDYRACMEKIRKLNEHADAIEAYYHNFIYYDGAAEADKWWDKIIGGKGKYKLYTNRQLFELCMDDLESIEKFFKGGWYSMMTDVDGKWLIKKLRVEEGSDRKYATQKMYEAF